MCIATGTTMQGGSIPWVSHFLFLQMFIDQRPGLESFENFRYSCTGKNLDEKSAEQDEKLEEQERRTDAAIKNLELKLLTKFEETSTVQSVKFAELEQKMERKMTALERKMTAQEKKITDQQITLTCIFPLRRS